MSDPKVPPPLTSGEIEELERLLEKATPGGWYVTRDINGRFCVKGAGSYSVADFYQAPAGDAEATATLTAKTHNALPRLLSSLKLSGGSAAQVPPPIDQGQASTAASDIETKRLISHDEAREIARRFINGHFGNTVQPESRPRITIPANTERDDDILLVSYIEQQRRRTPPSTAGWLPMASARIVSEALCRNHLSGFAEPCAGVCKDTIPGLPHPCDHAVTVHGSDAQEILRALKQEGASEVEGPPIGTGKNPPGVVTTRGPLQTGKRLSVGDEAADEIEAARKHAEDMAAEASRMSVEIERATRLIRTWCDGVKDSPGCLYPQCDCGEGT